MSDKIRAEILAGQLWRLITPIHCTAPFCMWV